MEVMVHLKEKLAKLEERCEEGTVMKVWVLCDDQYHPGSIVREGLKPLKNLGYQFDVTEDAGEWSEERMKEYDLIVFSKSNHVSSTDTRPWMSQEVQKAFAAYVRNGGGLLVIHSGTAGYRELPQIRSLFGGVFTNHPDQCPVTMEPREGHPLTVGCSSFTLQDEHYFIELEDTNVDIFLTTASEHGTQPGAWTREVGDGRVCVLSPGHNLEVWLHPSFQCLLQNSMKWCGKQNIS